MQFLLGRSPIYSYVLSTMQGIPLIRSYGAQTICIKEFIHRLDEYTRTFRVMIAISIWASIRLDSVVVVLITILTVSTLFIHRSISHSCKFVEPLPLFFRFTIIWCGSFIGVFDSTDREHSIAVSLHGWYHDWGKLLFKRVCFSKQTDHLTDDECWTNYRIYWSTTRRISNEESFDCFTSLLADRFNYFW
jgi:hypothetical protein